MTSRTWGLSALAVVLAVGAVLLLRGQPDTADPDAGGDRTEAREPVLQVRPETSDPREESGPTSSIQGIVVDERDEPVAGVRVEATRETLRRLASRRTVFDPPEPRPVVGTAVSGPDGRFQMALRPGGFLILAARPDPPLVGATVYPDLSGGGDLVLRVVRGSPLRVRVVDRDGAGLQAWVSAGKRSDVDVAPRAGGAWEVHLLRTDAAGRLEIGAAPPGRLTFSVTAPGRGTRSGIPVEAPTDDEVVLRLLEPGGGTIEGRVLDTAQRPVPGAVVTVRSRPSDDRHTEAFARTDERGGYRVEGLPAGRVDPGEASAKGYVGASGHSSGPTLVEGQTLRIDFVLLRGTPVAGRVLGDGAGLPGAVVNLRSTASSPNGEIWRTPGSVATDAEGRFRFDAVAPGSYRAEAEVAGWFLDGEAAEVVVPATGGDVAVDVALQRAVPASGVVLDEGRKPFPGATVTVRPEEPRSGHVPEAVLSAADGTFSFALHPDVSWTFEARTETHRAGSVPTKIVRPSTGPIELVLKKGARLAGRVTAEGGEPAAGASISISSDTTEHSTLPWASRGPAVSVTRYLPADREGRFSIEGLPAGTYVLRAGRGSDSATRTVDWGASVDDVLLRVAAPVIASGTVVDETGAPLAGVHLDLRNPRSNESSHAVTDAQGAFRTQVGEAVEHVVRVQGRDVAETVLGGGPPARIVASRASRRLLEGTVVDADGAPVPRAKVQVQLDPPGSMGWSAQASGGKFWVEVGGTAEPLIVSVSDARDWAGTRLDARSWRREGVNPAVGPLAVVLERGLAVEGRVVGPDGAPVSGVAVAKSHSDLVFGTSVRTDADGRFRLDTLDPGDVYLAVKPGPEWVSPQVPPAKAGTTDLTIRLERGRVVEGRVVGPRGEPVPGAIVAASTTGSSMNVSTSVTADATGTFRFEGMPDRPLNLSVSGPLEGPLRWTYLTANVEGVRAGTTPLVVRLGEGVTIEGEVVDAEGKPVVDGSVWAFEKGVGGPQTSLFGTNRFTVGPLRPGSYTLSFSGTGEMGTTKMEVVAPAKGVRIQARKALFVEGQVAGESVQGFQVTFHTPSGGGMGMTVDTSGRFSLKVDGDEAGTLFASREDDDRCALVENLRPGGGPRVLRLETGAVIEGRVDVPPPHKGMVWLRDLPRGINKNVALGEDGTFRFRGLPPGTYSISGHHEAAQLDEIKVAAGTTGVLLRGRVPANR